MAVVPAPVHFSAGDDIDTGDLLLKDRCLGRTELGINEVTSASWPKATRRSRDSYQRGTLCAPTTVVV
jgi:hypothetical protein